MASKRYKDKMEHAKLSWFLIECKWIYYNMHRFSDDLLDALEVTDYEYDKAERRYRRLCKRLNLEPTVYNMVGIDETKHSSQLAFRRLKLIEYQITKKHFTGREITNRLRKPNKDDLRFLKNTYGLAINIL